ncbi:MAG: hypothetical protein EPN92_06305 [Chitinophagaceae bacterium]|nr:MAG: hypothetical protein EPN92_06305 [Chitinophagaceae bacterium]
MDGQNTEKVTRKSPFRRFLTTLTVVIILALGGFIYWKYYFTYSEGNRTGLLQKFSHKGTIFKTYEGELILSSIRSSGNIALASEKFFFSVREDPTAKKLENLQGHFVTVHYKMKNGTLPWRGDSPYLVDSVELIKND